MYLEHDGDALGVDGAQVRVLEHAFEGAARWTSGTWEKRVQNYPRLSVSSCFLGSVDSARPVAEDGGAEGPQQGHGPAGDHIVGRHHFTAPSSGQCQEGICELRANVFVDGTKWICT